MHLGRILPPEDCCTEDLSSLQVVAGDLTQFLAPEPLHWVVYNRITFTILSLSEKSHWSSAQSSAREPSQKLLTSIRLPFLCFYYFIFTFIFWLAFLNLYVNSVVLFQQKWTLILWPCEASGSFKGKMNSLKSDSASHHSPCYCFMSKFPFVTGGLLLYSAVLVSALQQWESATRVHTSPLSWHEPQVYIRPLRLEPPSHPSWLSQSTRLSSRCYIATFHCCLFHMWQCICFSASLSIHPTLSFPCCVHFWEIILELECPRSCLGILGHGEPRRPCVFPVFSFWSIFLATWDQTECCHHCLDCTWPVSSE